MAPILKAICARLLNGPTNSVPSFVCRDRKLARFHIYIYIWLLQSMIELSQIEIPWPPLQLRVTLWLSALQWNMSPRHRTQYQHADECNILGNGKAMIQKEPIQPNDLIQSLPDSWSQWDCYVKENSTSIVLKCSICGYFCPNMLLFREP